MVATTNDMGESGGNSGEGSERATVGDERKSERDKISVRSCLTGVLYIVDFPSKFSIASSIQFIMGAVSLYGLPKALTKFKNSMYRCNDPLYS